MFGLTGPWGIIVKWLAVVAAVVALIGVMLGGVNAIYAKGKAAGAKEAEASYNEAMLDLQQKLTAKQTTEAQQINERLDKVLTFSEDAVTAVQLYTDQSRLYTKSVLDALKGKQLVSVVNGNCQFTPDFQAAWNQLRKVAP